MKNFHKNIKICNCTVASDQFTLTKKEAYSFCKRCGCIIFKKSDWKMNYTIKPKEKSTPNEINPIVLIKSMRKITEENYPHLKRGYNLNKREDKDLEKESKSMNIYLRHRNLVLKYLQKIMEIFDLSDKVFYQCLFFMDYVFIRPTPVSN